MIRVAVVSASAVAGGAERALAGLIRQLPRDVEPTVLLLGDGDLRRWLCDEGCRVVLFDAGRTRHLHRTVRTVAKIRAFLAESEVDVVLSSQSKSHVYGGLAAALAGRPAVWWQHEIPRRTRIEGVAGCIPAAAVVCGSSAAETAQRALTPRRRIVRIPPGVDVRGLAARRGEGATVRGALGWDDACIIGIIGRLQPSKGQETFLRAAALIARGRPDLRFVVVGGAILGWEGSYPNDLRKLAVDLGLSDRVHFAGHQEDPMPWFDACDVVVHAASDEPFGLVLVEAMALGKPLVASDSGGPRDIVETGVSGLLVTPGEAGALAAAIERIVSDPELAARLGEAAALRAGAFSEELMAPRFAELLREVAAAPGTPRHRTFAGDQLSTAASSSRATTGQSKHEP